MSVLLSAATRRGIDLPTIAPGVGSGGFLVAAIVVAFMALAGLVAFQGTTPTRSSDAPAGQTVIAGAGNGGVGPSSAATASAVRPGGDGARGAGGAAAGAGGGTASAGDTAGGGADATESLPQPPVGTPPSGPETPAPPDIGPTAPTQPGLAPAGDVGSLVNELDETVAGVSPVDPGLGEATAPLTGARRSGDRRRHRRAGAGPGGDRAAGPGRLAPVREPLLEPAQCDRLELGIVLDRAMVPAGEEHQARGLARAALPAPPTRCRGRARRPRRGAGSAAWGRDRRRPRAGRARRARRRGPATSTRISSESSRSPRRSPSSEAGQIAIAPAIPFSVAAAWIAR